MPDPQIDILHNQISAAPDSSREDDRFLLFGAAHEPTFKWSDKVSGDRFAAAILDAYGEVVKWKRNVILFPLCLRHRDCLERLANPPPSIGSVYCSNGNAPSAPSKATQQIEGERPCEVSRETVVTVAAR